MRPGIRLHIVLALAGLMLLAFVPLYFAVASLSRASLRASSDGAALSIAKGAAGQVSQFATMSLNLSERADSAQTKHIDDEARTFLERQRSALNLHVLALYTPGGRLVSFVHDGATTYRPPDRLPGREGAIRSVKLGDSVALEIVVPGEGATTLVVANVQVPHQQARSVSRLVALYMGLFALCLLVFTYIVLTRSIVRPIEQLSFLARRVAQGQGPFIHVPAGAKEIVELSRSLDQMTKQLEEEQKQLQEKVAQLQRTTKQLTDAQRHLVRSERLASVGRLAAGLAHEIGNPIAAILGFQELMLQGDLSPQEQHDFVCRMKRETERIHNVLRQLLDFARPAAVSKTGAMVSGSVFEAVTDAVALLEPKCARQDIAVHCDVPRDLAHVVMETQQLTQILVNLLFNAVDAIGKAGNVWVRGERIGDEVRIEVADDGPGVSEAVRDCLFEPFVTTKEVGAGTGLGLSVCKGLVESAGGSIEIVDDVGTDAPIDAETDVATDTASDGTGERRSKGRRGATFEIVLAVALGADDERGDNEGGD